MNGKKVKMRIGVDVRSLSEPMTGIGRYTENLLNEMISNRSHEWILYSYKPIKYGKWNKSNVTVRFINLPLWFKGVYFFWLQFLLPFWLKQDQIDLFWSPAHRIPRFTPKSILKVITIHDLVWKYFPETMRPIGRVLDSFIMPYAIKHSDWIIASSQNTSDEIINEFPQAKDKTSVVYLGSSLIRGKKSKNIEIKGNYLLFVGTIEPRKNLIRLLEAYSLLSENLRDNYSLVIVGGKGWGNENLKSTIEQLKIVKNVKVLGYLLDKDLESVYSNAYLFVMPSLYEGFGLPVLEAMSLGIPVLTSNTSSLPEVVGDTAILVNPTSVTSINNGIEQLLNDFSLRQKLSKAVLERSKLFSWNKASNETIKVFEKALSSRTNTIT